MALLFDIAGPPELHHKLTTGVTIIARFCLFLNYWRASVASETLTGVTQSKIGDVYWRASVASETVLGVDNAKSGILCYMYICMWDGTYAL